MPALPDVANTLKVEMQYLWSGENAENVFYFKKSSAPGGTDTVSMAAAVKAAYDANLKISQSSDAVLQRIIVTELTSVTSPRTTYTTGLPSAGSLAQDSVPNNSAAVINWAIGTRFRGGHPRTMQLGTTEASTEGPVLTDPAVAAFDTAWSAFINDILAAMTNYTHVMVSYYHNKARRAVPETFVLGTPSTQKRLGSMKTRLPGRRRHRRPQP